MTMWFRTKQTTEAQTVTFRQCPFCTYDFVTGEGRRSCHYYECPYLPEELDARCPVCLFNFAANDGAPACGDPPDCEFAREVAPQRVANLEAWSRARVRATDT
jgi:hypothetical protein